MAIHELKTWPGPFAAVVAEEKKVEVRECKDRTFAVGDELFLRRWTRDAGYSAGTDGVAAVLVRVTHMIPGLSPGSKFANLIRDGVCVMSIAPIDVYSPETPFPGGL
jgi:hypothetical protein